MPAVRTQCPSCDTIVIEADAMTLRRSLGDATTEAHFVCPDCLAGVIQPLSDRMVPVLIGAGCNVEDVADGGARSMHPANGAITETEILAFRDDLERSGWLDELLEG